MEVYEIKTKLEEEKNAMQELESKKRKLDEKIAIKKKKIDEYERLIQSQMYSEIDKQLESLGLSREILLSGLQNGDLLTLQEMIERQGGKE